MLVVKGEFTAGAEEEFLGPVKLGAFLFSRDQPCPHPPAHQPLQSGTDLNQKETREALSKLIDSLHFKSIMGKLRQKLSSFPCDIA